MVLQGKPDGTGIAMTSGTVLLGAVGSDPARHGPIIQLDGHQLTANLSGPGSPSERARLYLVITGAQATGRLSVSPGGEQ